jgi:hypothetical protein
LRLLKRFSVDAAELLRGEVDLLALNACDLHRHPTALRASEIIGVAETAREGVLFTRTNAGLTSLKDLVGRSVLFPDPALSLTILAKARLVGAGLRAGNLRPNASAAAGGAESGQPALGPSEIIARVLRGEADAGVCHRSLFERHRHQGLAVLDQFPEAPKVLAVRRDLDPLLVGALRRALAAAELRRSWPESTFLPATPEAADTSDDSILRYVRTAIGQAELFDANRQER